jgi:general secretion pathway protein J
VRRRKGFTLLEVLVAVTLLAVIVTLALGGLRIGARSWDAGNERLDHVGAFHTSYRFLRQMLSQAFPATTGEEGNLRFAFRGNERELQFVVVESPRAGLPGAFVVALRVAGGTTGRELRVVLAPFRPDKEGLAVRAATEEDEGVLFTNAARIGFSYFGSRRAGDSLEWSSVWDAPDNMPRLVRLEVEGGDGIWPEIVVPVAITMDADCAILVPAPLRKCRLDEKVRQ